MVAQSAFAESVHISPVPVFDTWHSLRARLCVIFPLNSAQNEKEICMGSDIKLNTLCTFLSVE